MNNCQKITHLLTVVILGEFPHKMGAAVIWELGQESGIPQGLTAIFGPRTGFYSDPQKRHLAGEASCLKRRPERSARLKDLK